MRKRPSKFFQAGGALNSTMPSYVKRSADDELFEKIREGELCYVLTPRQMGKSSLIFSTERRVTELGYNTTFVDLSEIGTVDRSEMDSWYIGILNKIKEDLRLELEPVIWWESKSQPPPQRFLDFLRQIADDHVDERWVLFFDEVDSTLRLDFRADFFAAIRSIVNAQARDKALHKITFVLMGVALPGDLINDNKRTPFNVGAEIPLTDLTMKEAEPFIKGLTEKYPGQAHKIFKRIYFWTNGQPYLTQRLCLEVLNSNYDLFSDAVIDGLVKETFKGASHKDTNTRDIESLILSFSRKNRILRTYKSIYNGENVLERQNNTDQARLKLSGLVKSEDGYLAVRNRLYNSIFNERWVRRNTESQAVLYTAVSMLTIFSILIVGLFLYNWVRTNQASAAFDVLARSDNPAERVDAFKDIYCRIPAPILGQTFYDNAIDGMGLRLKWQEQSQLFDHRNYLNQSDCLVRAIEGTSIALTDYEDIETTWLLEVMHNELNELIEHEQIKEGPEIELRAGLDSWIKGRNASAGRNYNDAVILFSSAITTTVNNVESPFYTISLPDVNYAVLFDRAKAYSAIGEYELASLDIEQILSIENVDTNRLPTPDIGSLLPQNPTATRPVTTAGQQATATKVVSPSPTSDVNLPVLTPTPSNRIQTFFHQPPQRWAIVRDYILSNRDLRMFLAENENGDLENLSNFVGSYMPTQSAVAEEIPTATSLLPTATSVFTVTVSATESIVEVVELVQPTEVITGVVMADVLTSTVPASSVAITATLVVPTIAQRQAAAKVGQRNAAIFECTSPASKNLGVIRAQEDVDEILGRVPNNGWIKVKHRGIVGWAAATFLEISDEDIDLIQILPRPKCNIPTPTPQANLIPINPIVYFTPATLVTSAAGSSNWSFSFQLDVPAGGNYAFRIGDGAHPVFAQLHSNQPSDPSRETYVVRVTNIKCESDFVQALFVNRNTVDLKIVNTRTNLENREVYAPKPCG